ncbi:hypothetical protein [Halomarina rubra]|uniref:C2H2-type domain-containing protein n=1 Tax=Halomarina rubra TaxID=2071873 RepID=A0ABD6AZM8_9EURY|nr:hypothetical protein [Halomarina rubra]
MGGDETDRTDREREHTCEACGRTFETAAALGRHVHDVGLVD